MPPPPNLVSRSTQTAADFFAVREQWQNPDDILTLLMIIGGDVVKGALAQLASSHPRPFTPIAFSFGWVAYSFSAILSVVGSRRLAPEPDCHCTLIEVESGYPRDVNSWVLARLVRDYEPQNGRGLEIAFFEAVSHKSTGIPDRDWVYYLGVFIIFLQLGIAAIPGVLDGNWLVMIIAFGGNFLAQIQAALPQWREELWKARRIEEGKSEVVCLTKGNGSSYVMVIRSDGSGHGAQLKLGDLAGGREVRSEKTVYATFVLVVLWFAHLLMMQGLENDHWYMLAIGAAGIFQNIIAASACRQPEALGFHLKKTNTIHKDKVFEALKDAEQEEKRVGFVLLDVFFPGGLRPKEEEWKQERIAEYERGKRSK